MTSDPFRIADAFPNLREVRDLPAPDGRRLRRGAIYRSEAVLGPDAGWSAALQALGIKLVIDLRSPAERDKAPNAWWRAQRVAIEEIDLVADARNAGTHWEQLLADPDGAGGEAMMLATYRTMPRAIAPHLDRIFGTVADGTLPVLIHCTAGKDRTGFVVALLLAAAGITPQAIEEDYLESGRRENPAVSAGTRALLADRLGRAPADRVLKALTGVDPRYLRASFAAIDADCGGMEAYLDAAGWPAARRAALRDRLLL